MQGGRFTPANVFVVVGPGKQGMGHGMAGQQVLSAWCDGTSHPVGGGFNTVVEGRVGGFCYRAFAHVHPAVAVWC
jgi:hypothetical protein